MSRIMNNIQQNDAQLDARIFFRTPDQDINELDHMFILGINPSCWSELKDRVLLELVDLSAHDVHGDLFYTARDIHTTSSGTCDPATYMEFLDSVVDMYS